MTVLLVIRLSRPALQPRYSRPGSSCICSAIAMAVAVVTLLTISSDVFAGDDN